MSEGVVAALITGGLGLVGAAFALVGVRSLRAEMSLGLLSARVESYRKLWAATRPFSKTDPRELTADVRAAADENLRRWYFDDGGALLLSKRAHGKLMAAWDGLRTWDESQTQDDDAVRALFSALRTRLKGDLRVYGILRDVSWTRSSEVTVRSRPEGWPQLPDDPNDES